MANKKIQEWHLAPELLQKISSGNGDMALVLADYIKKTDLIDRTQLNDNCFTGILQQLQSIRENYRNKNIRITRDDMDDALTNFFHDLEEMQEASGYTKEQIDAIIQSYFAVGGPVDTHIERKIPTIVDEVIEQSDLNNRISSIAEKTNTTDVELTRLKQTVASNKQLADDIYRSQNDKITQEDLDADLTKTLNDVSVDIQELQKQIEDAQEQSFGVGGIHNQVILINDENEFSAADIVEQIEIATTTEELNAARAALKTPILSLVAPQAVYSINLPSWNNLATTVAEEVNIPKPPEPEPTYYHVIYQYISNNNNYPLTTAIQNTLPVDQNNYENGNEVFPVEPSTTTFTESNGIWTFIGWDKTEDTISDTDIRFIGTWNFEQNIVVPTYSIRYEYYNADTASSLPIPSSVLDTLPPIEIDKHSGYYATPPNPYQSFVFDGDQLWQFISWDNEGIEIEESDITFYGGWEPVAIEAGNTEYEIYRHTYKASYQYSGTLPDEVLDTLPPETKGFTNNTEVEAIEPEITTVQKENQVWTFVGWDSNKKKINNADIVFTGTWVYSELPYYSVLYTYIGKRPDALEDETVELPVSVTDTIPANESHKLSGTNVFPANPSVMEITVDDGKWIFAGWDASSQTINDDNVTFTGTWEFEEKVVEPPYVHSSYVDYNLAAGHYIKSEGATISVSAVTSNGEQTISGSNSSSTNTAAMCIGIYGTRVKLYTSLFIPEQTIRLSVDNTSYLITLPSSKAFVDEENHIIDQGHFCFFCLEKLSEGPHRICFAIEPGKSFTIDSKISIDDGDHAGLLLASDIPDEAFYSSNLHDTGNYVDVLTGSYSFTPSSNVHVIGIDDYQQNDFETAKSGYERRLLYSPTAQKLFYMTDKGVLIVLSQPYDERLASLESRIAALEG